MNLEQSLFNCSVVGCSSIGKSKGRKYFKYPLHSARAKEWLRLSGRLDLSYHKPSVLHHNYLICDLHFEKEDIIRSHICNTGKPKLYLPYVSEVREPTPPLNRNSCEDSEIDEDIKISTLSEMPSTSSHQAREDASIPCPETETSDDLKSSEDEFEDDTDLHELEESIRKQILGDQKHPSDALYAVEKTFIKTDEQTENLHEDSFLRKILMGGNENIYDDQMEFEDDIGTKSSQNNQTDDSASLQSQNTVIFENLQRPAVSTLKKENVLEPTDTKSIEYENKQNLQSLIDHSLVLNEENVSEYYETLQSQTENSKSHSDLKYIHDLENILSLYRSACKNDNEFNIFALNLYISSPAAYKVIRNTLQLPEIKILRSIKIDVSSRLNDKVLQCLKSKYQKLREFDKVCVINADIIPLKRSLYYRIDKDKIIGFHEINDVSLAQPATAVFVLMARGISSGWKQILGYCYLEKFQVVSVSKWIEEVISEMQEIGFKVVAFTSKYKTMFKDLWAEKSKTSALPYFDVNGKKIFYVLDILDLLVAMRDVFMNHHDFKFTDSEQRLEMFASWFDVLNLFRIENSKKRRLVPKLTKAHVMPEELQKSNGLYTIQVFSKSVAKAINLYAEVNELNEMSLGTAKLIELVNNLFDALNTSEEITHDEFKLACKSVNFQLEVIEKFLNVCSTIIIVDEKDNDVTDSTTCFKILKENLQNISILINSLVCDYDFKLIYTRNLIQESLDKFSEKVLTNYRNKKRLTAMRFEIAFRKQFVTNLLNNSHCKRKVDNLENLVKNAEELLSLYNLKTESNDTDLGIRDITAHRIYYSRGNQFFMVCVLLLKICQEIDTCDKIRLALPFPTEQFIDFIKAMDKQIDGAISTIAARQVSGVARHLYESLSELKFDAPCDCFPLDHLKKVFVRFTIFDLIKYNNQRFVQNDSQTSEYGFVRLKTRDTLR